MLSHFSWIGFPLFGFWLLYVIYQPTIPFVHPDFAADISKWIMIGIPGILAIMALIALGLQNTRNAMWVYAGRIYFLLTIVGALLFMWFFTPVFSAFK